MDQQQAYLSRAYSGISLDQPSMRSFLEELDAILTRLDVLQTGRSLLDIGCGRGYFLEHLRRKGLNGLQGIEPSGDLIQSALFPGIIVGSFEDNGFGDGSVDIVMTCHTLHHLPEPWPVSALQEMARITRRHVVVVEINNTNLPMFLLSAVQRNVEVNAFRYNRSRVMELFRRAGISIVYQANMCAGYLSGDSVLHRLAAACGSRPYNIVVGRS